MVAEVIVDIAASEVDRIFEYTCGEDLRPGCRVAVPFGARVKEGIALAVKEKSEYPAEKLKPVSRICDEPPALTEECLRLAMWLRDVCHVTAAAALRLFLPAEMRTGKVREKRELYVRAADLPAEQMLCALSGKANERQRALAEYLLSAGEQPFAELKKSFGGTVETLRKKGFALVYPKEVARQPYGAVAADKKTVALTPAQEEAERSILTDPRTVHLVFGVTGSGKTEVYLDLIESVLREGKTAIMLVPEIALTPQMLRQLRARFGDAAAIMHSGLSAGERYDEWRRLRSGSARVAIGARSAVFAPVSDLGLIVMDEEHDGSYLSGESPRYNTREVAARRAAECGAKLVLGSATPSVETFRRAQEGEYNLVRMPERINKRPLPEVIIADMRREIRRGNGTAFSAPLRAELESCLAAGNQAIVFLNRRGYSNTVICQECGYVAKCASCDVSLTYHLDEDALKCHYCDARYHMLTSCPACGSKFIRYGGTGTQRVVSELSKLFPAARILRMDNDTTRTKEGHFKILSAFGARQADILVGTQMIAKGHDFPAVTLVGILDADMSLHFADYRSGERTFQLITQVAGRSGRAEEKGKVVLQTYSPENYVLDYAVRYDYEGFYGREIALRRATGFPPFSRIIRVMVSGEKEAAALEALKSVYFDLKALAERREEDFLFFNKMKAPIKRIKNKFRYQVLMRVKADADVLGEVYAACDRARSREAAVYAEENPNNLS